VGHGLVASASATRSPTAARSIFRMLAFWIAVTLIRIALAVMASRRLQSRYEQLHQTDGSDLGGQAEPVQRRLPILGSRVTRRRPLPPGFQLFGKLPAELRILIWTHALRSTTSLRPPIIHQTPRFPFLAKERVPILLQVNREARHEAEKFYTQRTIRFFDYDNQPDMILFFSPGVETLFLSVDPLTAEPAIRRCECEAYCWCRRRMDWYLRGCACPLARLASRQMHLLRRFQSANTIAIKHVALYFDWHCHGWCEEVPAFIRRAFPNGM
jgi:hypothetical protein